MEVREVLEGMLDFLHEKEWIKDHLYKKDGRLYDAMIGGEVQGACLEGACKQVIWGKVSGSEWRPLQNDVNCAIINAAAISCPEKYHNWMHAMFQFNDFEETTREDVILAVKTAIAKEES